MAKVVTKTAYPAIPDSARGTVPKKDLQEILPPELMEALEAFVFEQTEAGTKIAAVDPDLPALRQFVANRLAGKQVQWFACTEQDIATILKNCSRDFTGEIQRLVGAESTVNGNVIEIVDRIITYALTEKASDLHIEPLRHETVVRFRVDGILHKMVSLPRNFHQAVIARIKILANLKIDEYRRAQDGRIEFEKLPDTSLRVSTVPTLHGEKVALRILDDSHKEFSIRHLGFSETHEAILRRNIEKPYGMIVTSGPTGSGKTTTLYGLLHLFKKEGVNISTLEDPIEYAFPGINQIQINPRVDLTFASGLRTLLRQDPDIIMVGEIRDSETAVMAANAALTGHLVLTTIHTNDAPSAFSRFLEMGVEDFVVASTVNIVIAQRLVRKICTSCAEKQFLSDAVLKKVKDRQDVMRVLKNSDVNTDELATLPVHTGKGCDECLQTGYAGRIGMYEILELNKEIHDAVLAHATGEHIRGIAERSGYQDMVTDGVSKVLRGETTFEEVIRVTRHA